VFFNEDTKNLLKNTFLQSHDNSSSFYGNSRGIYCEHSTIEFSPKPESLKKYKLHYGHVQKFIVLAYAQDEHGQAILVHAVGDNDIHPSMNEYPHVTISVSDVKPYTPVYSNDLWKRFVDDKIIEIKQDKYNKPQSVTIKNQSNEWNGKLSNNGKYEETRAYVKIMNEVIEIEGTVCANNLWKNDKCRS